ncbi:hypothetical protein GM3708_906 [Geminocystis sp. NIES-3708]|uniref:hypothetical protein n=1 Tax=Geminocystis sp. NIES-3708 TaxID=1615909 RepID=UPI0005FC8431|nr:hypothetical protein [Geminocystis sp. NIES-3708]BAQ60500.1 hypothetical protein GM3708_906 [Geminocystis sp. NIES-3708]
MERGLLWLPLLIVFIWLAWSGKKEYQKVEAYKVWAEKFEQSKYDIYSVLGKKGDLITWGKPTSKGIIQETTFSLSKINKLDITVKDKIADINSLSEDGEGNLQFLLTNNEIINVPFTDINLTIKWFNYLQKFINENPKI